MTQLINHYLSPENCILLLQISQLKSTPTVCFLKRSWKFSFKMKPRSLISLLTSLDYVLQSWETLEDSCANGSQNKN